MKKVRIGHSELMVNPIGLGTNAVGGHNVHGPVDEADGKKLIRQAVAAGIDHFDTAFIYGPERSEILLGEAIAELGVRQQVVIATKGAYKISDTGVRFDNTPEFLTQCVEDSLKRLKTDYIDLFYIHQPDETTPKSEAVAALKILKDEGKIRAIGVSNFTMEQLAEANQDGYVDAIQSEYSLLQRDVESDILPYCEQQGITFIPYFPLASGILTGKYTQSTPLAGFRTEHPMFQGDTFRRHLQNVEVLKEFAKEYGCESGHVALAWCLAKPAVDALIPGAKNQSQLLSNLKAGELALGQETIKELDALFHN